MVVINGVPIKFSLNNVKNFKEYQKLLVSFKEDSSISEIDEVLRGLLTPEEAAQLLEDGKVTTLFNVFTELISQLSIEAREINDVADNSLKRMREKINAVPDANPKLDNGI